MSRKPAVRASFLFEKQTTYLSFHGPGNGGTGCRESVIAAGPGELFISTCDAKMLLFHWPWPAIRNSDTKKHRAMVLCGRGTLPS